LWNILFTTHADTEGTAMAHASIGDEGYRGQ